LAGIMATMMREKRSKKWLWWMLAVAWAGLIFWLSSSSDGQGGFWLIRAIPYGDKLAHGFAFGVLGLFLYLAIEIGWLALMVVSFYGISDELHQFFVPGRSVDIYDWVADTIGAALAIFAVKFLTRGRT
jgi:hypothetical protein